MARNALVIATAAIAGFLFFAGGAPMANAYAVGPTAGSTSGSGSGPYDVGNSLQQLVSPFTGFLNSLKWTNTPGPAVDLGGRGTAPVQAVTPTAGMDTNIISTIKTTVMGWLTAFDDWFYGISGVRLSGILFVILNALAWTLGMAQAAVNWLLGLFH